MTVMMMMMILTTMMMMITIFYDDDDDNDMTSTYSDVQPGYSLRSLALVGLPTPLYELPDDYHHHDDDDHGDDRDDHHGDYREEYHAGDHDIQIPLCFLSEHHDLSQS